jgi:hypothetical protein
MNRTMVMILIVSDCFNDKIQARKGSRIAFCGKSTPNSPEFDVLQGRGSEQQAEDLEIIMIASTIAFS